MRVLNLCTSRRFHCVQRGSGMCGAFQGMDLTMIGSWSEVPCTLEKSSTSADEGL